MADPTRVVFAGGHITPGATTNAVNYITILTQGDAVDFGDATIPIEGANGCSNGHGGLQ